MGGYKLLKLLFLYHIASFILSIANISDDRIPRPPAKNVSRKLPSILVAHI
jgi:hypothetical protein